MRRALVLLVAVGCGRVDFAPIPDAAVVARLKLRYFESPEGQRLGDRIVDTQLATTCVPRDTTLGLRCIPDAMFTLYADDTCTHEVGIKFGCTDAAYIQRPSNDPLTFDLYTVGAPVSGSTFYSRSGSTCSAFPGTFTAYELGDAVPLTAFAPMTLEMTPAGRMVEVEHVADGGLRSLAYFIDTALGNRQCGLQATASGLACLPFEDVAYAEYSLDASCTQHVGNFRAGEQPRVMWWIDRAACQTTDIHAYEVGTAITPSTVYSGYSTATCGMVTNTPTGPFYKLGAELSLQVFTEQARSTPGARLQVVERSGGGVTVPDHFFDSTLGVPCTPRIADDGVMRCVPYGAFTTNLYTSSTCTTQVKVGAWIQTGFTCNEGPFRFASETLGADTCNGRVTTYELGAPLSGTIYLKDASNQCQGYNIPPLSTYYSIVRTVPASELAPITETVP